MPDLFILIARLLATLAKLARPGGLGAVAAESLAVKHLCVAMGGNKARKLEFLLGEAIERKADTIVTFGAVQSNHCRMTAAAACKLGLKSFLVLSGEKPDVANGNFLLAVAEYLEAAPARGQSRPRHGDRRARFDEPDGLPGAVLI